MVDFVSDVQEKQQGLNVSSDCEHIRDTHCKQLTFSLMSTWEYCINKRGSSAAVTKLVEKNDDNRKQWTEYWDIISLLVASNVCVCTPLNQNARVLTELKILSEIIADWMSYNEKYYLIDENYFINAQSEHDCSCKVFYFNIAKVQGWKSTTYPIKKSATDTATFDCKCSKI